MAAQEAAQEAAQKAAELAAEKEKENYRKQEAEKFIKKLEDEAADKKAAQKAAELAAQKAAQEAAELAAQEAAQEAAEKEKKFKEYIDNIEKLRKDEIAAQKAAEAAAQKAAQDAAQKQKEALDAAQNEGQNEGQNEVQTEVNDEDEILVYNDDEDTKIEKDKKKEKKKKEGEKYLARDQVLESLMYRLIDKNLNDKNQLDEEKLKKIIDCLNKIKDKNGKNIFNLDKKVFLKQLNLFKNYGFQEGGIYKGKKESGVLYHENYKNKLYSEKFGEELKGLNIGGIKNNDKGISGFRDGMHTLFQDNNGKSILKVDGVGGKRDLLERTSDMEYGKKNSQFGFYFDTLNKVCKGISAAGRTTVWAGYGATAGGTIGAGIGWLGAGYTGGASVPTATAWGTWVGGWLGAGGGTAYSVLDFSEELNLKGNMYNAASLVNAEGFIGDDNLGSLYDNNLDDIDWDSINFGDNQLGGFMLFFYGGGLGANKGQSSDGSIPLNEDPWEKTQRYYQYLKLAMQLPNSAEKAQKLYQRLGEFMQTTPPLLSKLRDLGTGDRFRTIDPGKAFDWKKLDYCVAIQSGNYFGSFHYYKGDFAIDSVLQLAKKTHVGAEEKNADGTISDYGCDTTSEKSIQEQVKLITNTMTDLSSQAYSNSLKGSSRWKLNDIDRGENDRIKTVLRYGGLY